MNPELKTSVSALLGIRDGIAQSVPQGRLTHREKEVLVLIAMGKTSRQIAGLLKMSFHTAVSHRYHIQQKFELHTTADLTRAAIRMGLVEP